MNQENNDKQKEDCPLCETTKEAVNTLKTNKDSEIKNKKSSRKIKTILLGLVIILAVVGGYKTLSKSPSMSPIIKDISIQGQTINISGKTSPQINDFAPNFVSEDVYGNKFALNNFQGERPVLLVFWATWCGYCAKELPDLKIFTKRYQGLVQVIAVDSGESKQTIKEYIQKKDINFLVLLDEQRKIWNQYLVRGTPTHFLIDKEGKIIAMRPGLASSADLEIMLSMISFE